MLSLLTTNHLGAVLIALLCGLAVPFSFAPYEFLFLDIICLATMLLLVRPFSRRFSSFLWCIFALGMFGYGVWWIQVSVHQFGLPLYSFSISVTAALIIIQALQVCLFGWLAKDLLSENNPWMILLGVPASWVAVEFLRSWFGSGFPWLLLGYAHVESPLGGFAPIGGAYLVSYFVMLVASALYLTIHQRKFSWMFYLILVIGLGYGLSKISWVSEFESNQRTVALIQGAIPQEIKWHPDVRQPSIDLYLSLTEPHWDSDIVVWPETAIAAFPEEVNDTHRLLKERAVETETVFLLGSPTRENAEKTQYFNSLLLVNEPVARYDKRHLVPFGEYMPFDSILRPITDLLNVPMSDFSKGQAKSSTLDAGSIVIGSSICYEDAYSGLLRDALPAANVLVNVSNDAWFGDTIAPHQHLQISQMRALELGRYMLRATNTGISAIVDHRGRVLAESSQFEPQALVGEFKLLEGSTPFARFGSLPIFSFSVLLLLVLRFRKK